ncbi:fumarylacetoacetate (FAA) hydrolase [Acidimicrobium ferrooxidans DSM 10331]|uniref:Fumarylacetoacetate (FAA) hydrolase n=1 Tax=Acidimicrobium ferrooxidans (strain DSM 10331 / JCM 15462 / NBRC 103882 / ICP) TaxID=525909 RepID=C7LZF6_ACIFD|nr:fumarylacetoacetate (FAA) hydrolase [Acidimicrobium ferrooxidans]ACU54114.1 fumarylacetoacetate (FAA) hydrolase [Acidimicrobium ferrooxidans DSM 10331]
MVERERAQVRSRGDRLEAVAELLEASEVEESDLGTLSLEDAYEVQARLWARRDAHGAVRSGWKVGLTDEAARRRMGLEEPIFGPLAEHDRIGSGSDLSLARLVDPRLEVEVALRVAERIQGILEPDEVDDVVDELAVAFEIPDSRIVGWPVRGRSLIADRAGAGLWVLGDRVASRDGIPFDRLVAIATRDGTEVVRGGSEAVLGDPRRSFAWLTGAVARHGGSLEPGEWVLAGTLTPMVPLVPGHWEGIIEGVGSVRLVVVP